MCVCAWCVGHCVLDWFASCAEIIALPTTICARLHVHSEFNRRHPIGISAMLIPHCIRSVVDHLKYQHLSALFLLILSRSWCFPLEPMLLNITDLCYNYTCIVCSTLISACKHLLLQTVSTLTCSFCSHM